MRAASRSQRSRSSAWSGWTPGCIAVLTALGTSVAPSLRATVPSARAPISERSFSISSSLLWAVAGLPTSVSRATPRQAEVGLEEILQRLANLSRLYRDTALQFTSDETIADIRYATRSRGEIVWSRRPMRKTHRFRYFYVFAAPTDDSSVERLVDYRNVLDKKQADGSLQEVDLTEVDLPSYIMRAYSWAFLFQESLQKRFRYELVGQQKALGRKATVISFEPIPPFEKGFNEWFGKAGVDLETAQLLKVESIHQLYHATMAQLEELEETDELPDDTLVVRVSTEFGEERNGMRFPSKVNLVGTEYWTPGPTRNVAVFGLTHAPRATESIVFRVNQTYKDYRFFSVRTEEEIRRISKNARAQR